MIDHLRRCILQCDGESLLFILINVGNHSYGGLTVGRCLRYCGINAAVNAHYLADIIGR